MKIRVLILSVILSLLPIEAFSADWVPMTSGTTSNLSSVWGASASDVFAVGAGGTILHYDGSSWSSMASGTTVNLKGVWGSSGTDVFAVGDGGIILHYNGSAWSAMASGTTYDLNAVWGASGSDVFAVGAYRNIINFDGTAWSSSMMESCGAGDPYTCYTFNSVWGSSGTDVYAAGIGYKTECFNHYNGNNWQCNTAPFGFNNAIWGSSSSDVFTAGTWIWHNGGSGWSMATGGYSGHTYYGIWGSSGHDVFFAGTEGYITHYNGTSFSPMTSGTTNKLNGVWGASGSDVFSVGASGTILHYTGSTSTTTVPLITTTTTAPATLVELSSFTVTPEAGKVILQWNTESEIDNAGFNIYRADASKGEYVKINAALIPAEGSSTQGSAYEFADTSVRNRKTCWYRLEDLALNGVSTMHGPVSATPRLLYGGR
jgi:hypothetical protein